TPLIATRFHDLAIHVAGLFGMVSFGLTVVAMGRQGRLLAALARLTLVFVVASYFVWETGWHVAALPILQKLAFAAFLSWVVAVSWLTARSSDVSPPLG